jgi:hypothetical protein
MMTMEQQEGRSFVISDLLRETLQDKTDLTFVLRDGIKHTGCTVLRLSPDGFFHVKTAKGAEMIIPSGAIVEIIIVPGSVTPMGWVT